MIPAAQKRKFGRFSQKDVDIWQGRWAKIFMANISLLSPSFPSAGSRLLGLLLAGGIPAAERFLTPLGEVLPGLSSRRVCIELTDEDWLTVGVLRVLFDAPSGRGFLQEVGSRLPFCPNVPNFFSALRSERRLALCRDADAALRQRLSARLPDVLSDQRELRDFEVFAGDGHWHGAAVHDVRPFPESSKLPCGHFYALDLRRGLLHHITAADQVDREHEHDMRALKRQTIEALRRGAKKGRKTLYVWDKASIDFEAWEVWKRSGIYFLSQEKSNMVVGTSKALPWDAVDPRNAGIQKDERCQYAGGATLRRIEFIDPVTKVLYVFLTNEMTLPPGLLAELARRRWNIEKVFDELKNKLGETRAWATSATAKSMQALFICLAHQLLLAFEHLLDQQEDIRPEAELQRRASRLAAQERQAAKNGLAFPSLRSAALRLTQRTAKFLRWLRASLLREAPWPDLLAILRLSYAAI